ncbi:MAG: PEP-CTERM sorting domain-containing protein [Tepidisphaeraceae bacterium]|jgi:hypothetical protein
MADGPTTYASTATDNGTASSDGGATWGTINSGNAAAFEIDGTVPEPVSLSVVVLGAVALLARRRRA